jgi:hopene-associated glycosyltransferase HpnB
MNLTIGAATVSLCIWLYLLLGRGWFWKTEPFRAGQSAGVQKQVVAVVAARDEADVIGRAVSSLLRQQGVRLRVIVVDDASADGTAEIARSAGARTGTSDRLDVLRGAPLPHGWTGKLWAIQQGIRAAEQYAPDYLLLTDADVEHDAGLVSTLVARADRDGLDLASLMVKLHCSTIPEKLLIPPFVYFFFKLYPPNWIANPRTRTAGAAGGCILIRPEALKKAGGVAAVRAEIIDDCSLASRVKQTGGKVWLAPTDSAHSIRPYTSFGGISRMIARTAFNQLRHSTWMLAIAIFGLVLTYLVPIVVLFSANKIAITLGAITLALMLVAYTPTVRYFRLNLLWTVTLSGAAIFYLGSTVRSAIDYWTGRGGQWKGRSQDRAGATHD